MCRRSDLSIASILEHFDVEPHGAFTEVERGRQMQQAGQFAERWQNWAGNQECRPSRIVRPRSLEELRDAVVEAGADGLGVRVMGSGHSFTPVVCTTGVLLDLAQVGADIEIDSARAVAKVPAGASIRDLVGQLWRHGFSLSNQGDIDTQTIAGALSTATHGSGLRQQSFSAALRAVEYIAPDGSISSVTDADPTIDAFRTSLGVLGVLNTVELSVTPAYQLSERVDYWPLEKVLERWQEEMAERRHFSFFWGPQDQSLALYGLGDPGAATYNCYVKRYDELPPDVDRRDTPGRRVGPAYEIYAMTFEPGWDELEYFVPFDAALDAMDATREAMTRHPDQPFPMEVRAIAGETSWMSPMTGRDSVSISVSGATGTDYRPYLRDVHATLTEFDGRGHWGKLHLMDAERLATTYPHYDDFIRLRRSLDPAGVFLNDHLAALLA